MSRYHVRLTRQHCFFIFFLIVLWQEIESGPTSKQLPDLSKLRQTETAESSVDLSLSIGLPYRTKNIPLASSLGKNGQDQAATVYDTRTIKFKEIQSQNPDIDLRTKKQKIKHATQKRYNDNLRSRLTSEQLIVLKQMQSQRKKASLKRKIEKTGFNYGKLGQLQMLSKKFKEQGQLSKEESEKLESLRENTRMMENQRKKKNQTKKST